MELYLLRHGSAAPKSMGVADAELPLTKQGERMVEKSAVALRLLKIRFDRILSSPYLRAYQTAEIIAKGLGLKRRLEKSDALKSGATLEKIRPELEKAGPDDRILLVGHEPDLGQIIAAILRLGPGQALPLGKGDLCRVDWDPSEPGELVFILSAELLGQIARQAG
ncbi:MAG: phosphohistidine phosphatase SixA [Deltaproteobacteria bacterium RBG_13_61_14]|nr:MAG: phosphohistidine phosphatase SixA [Deltaproteobacteria bacterium RBG_13_61_14]